MSRLTSEQNGAGATVGYGYDLISHLTSITYPGALTVTYGYDTGDRLTTVKDWLGNTMTYTPNANSFNTSIAYQNGVTATQTPDNADRLMGITDKLSSTTLASMTYTRDGNNQLTGETDSGVPQVAQPFTYTPLNQVKAAGAASYGYDAADNLTTLTNGTNQFFDAADELCWSASTTGTSCSSHPSGATTYSYDSRGDRTGSAGSATITYGYDEASRLTSYTSATETATYKYDGDGLRMSKTVNGVTTPFTWDPGGSTPLLLSDGTTDYIYGSNGTPIEQETVRPAISLVGDTTATGGTGTTTLTVNFPSGTQANDQVFVDTSQSAGTTVSAPSTYTLVASVATGGTAPKGGTSVFRHTVVSGETSMTLTYGGTASVKAVVLAVYRGVDPSLPVDVFAKSQAAGATSVVGPSVSPAFANERLLIFQGARGTFSAKTWTAPTGTSEEVQVNSLANVSAGLADQALSASGATGTRTSSFGVSANLTTVVVAIPQPASVLFYQTDQLASTRLLTNSAGLVRGTFSYDAYGNLIGSTGAYSTPLSWGGQYRDVESGLVYLQARYFDPTTGQLLSQDSLLATTRQPYSYGSDNPLNTVDPSGNVPLDGDGRSTFPSGLTATTTLNQGPNGRIYWTAGVLGVVGNKAGTWTITLVDPSGDESFSVEKTLNIYGGNQIGRSASCSVGLWQLQVTGTGVTGSISQTDVESCPDDNHSSPCGANAPGIYTAASDCSPEYVPNPFEPVPPSLEVPSWGWGFDPIPIGLFNAPWGATYMGSRGRRGPMSEGDIRGEGASLPAYEESLHALAQELAAVLAPDRWGVTAGRFLGNANDPGPLGIRFSNPVSSEFHHGLGRKPRELSQVRAELTQTVATEREFSIVHRVPLLVTHPELLSSLRFKAFAYRWTARIMEQVADALVGGRALEPDEADWVVRAGPVIWGPIPDWVDELWRE